MLNILSISWSLICLLVVKSMLYFEMCVQCACAYIIQFNTIVISQHSQFLLILGIVRTLFTWEWFVWQININESVFVSSIIWISYFITYVWYLFVSPIDIEACRRKQSKRLYIHLNKPNALLCFSTVVIFFSLLFLFSCLWRSTKLSIFDVALCMSTIEWMGKRDHH